MDYRPGERNISGRERTKRLVAGVSGFLASSVVFLGNPFDSLASMAAFLMLLLVGFEGLYQWRFSFCPGYAHSGVYGGEDERCRVEDAKDREKDEREAWKIHSFSPASSVAAYAVLQAAFIASGF